jgi:predicted nucleotidyltransferase component of viral defense system
MAAERTGLDLMVEFNRPDSDMVRVLVGWDDVRLAVDLNRAERHALAVERRELHLPYSDLSRDVRGIRVVALEEILANKWYMLDDRKEPRDLFDLWSGICVRGVPLDSVADAFRVKYSAKPSLWRVERAWKLEAAWEERLAHQVNDLPPFPEVFGEVHARVRAWEEGV